MPVAPVGTMGSVYLEDNLDRHKLAIFMYSVFVVSIVTMTLREKVPFVKKVWPMDMKLGNSMLAQSWGALVWAWCLYSPFVTGDSPRFPPNFLVTYRLELVLGLMTVLTGIYFAARKWVFAHMETRSRNIQSANTVRVIVKVGLFLYWGTGDFFKTATYHPLELTDEMYFSSYIFLIGIGSLYTWEVVFRELAPVNIVHHLMACIGVGCVMEWASVVEPIRTCTSMSLIASAIEGFCCMGTMAYKMLPKGALLQRILLAETIFVAVSYNLILVGQMAQYFAYYDLFGPAWKFCMPCLAVFTYPAQMNMARIFYSLYKKSGKPVEAVASPAIKEGVVAPEIRRRDRTRA